MRRKEIAVIVSSGFWYAFILTQFSTDHYNDDFVSISPENVWINASLGKIAKVRS